MEIKIVTVKTEKLAVLECEHVCTHCARVTKFDVVHTRVVEGTHSVGSLVAKLMPFVFVYIVGANLGSCL